MERHRLRQWGDSEQTYCLEYLDHVLYLLLKQLEMRNIKFILLFLFPVFVNAQIISTIAGDGLDGYSGDGAQATTASFKAFAGLAFDTSGNLYIADANNNRIRKITLSTGIINTIAGTGVAGYNGDSILATTAKLSDPKFVACDKFDNLYISDVGNDRIRKVNLISGLISTYAGTGVNGFSGDGGQATVAKIYGPQGLVVDNSGNLFFSDDNNYRIRKIGTTGIIQTIVGNGIYSYSGDGGLADTASITGAEGICIDKMGNLILTDCTNLRIRKVNAITNIISSIAGTGIGGFSGDGGPATNATMTIPYGVSCDSLNNIYISDMYNSRIRKVDTMGIINTVIGKGINGFYGDGGEADTAEIYYPQITAFDPCGNLYIADLNNFRVRKVSFDPSCTLYSHFDSVSLYVKSITTDNINIYPNPSVTSITISANNKINQITITNLIGQIVYTQVYDIEKAEINIAGLPEGVYTVKVTDNEGKITMNKIVKQ